MRSHAATDRLDALERSLEGTADAVVRTTAAEFRTALADQLDPPAVGTSLPFEGVSLAGTGVSLDLTPRTIEEARTGVTAAGLAIANYGTVTIRSTPAGDEPVSLYPERHVAVVRASDVVPDMPAAFDRLAEEFAAGDRSQVLATGPSATADMGSLVTGVHGPKSVRVLVLEDR